MTVLVIPRATPEGSLQVRRVRRSLAEFTLSECVGLGMTTMAVIPRLKAEGSLYARCLRRSLAEFTLSECVGLGMTWALGMTILGRD